MVNIIDSIIGQDNFIYIAVAIGVPLIMYLIYRRVQKVPKMVDYIKIYRDGMIQDEDLNKPDSFLGMKGLWRGNMYLGKINTISESQVKLMAKPLEETKKVTEWKDVKRDTMTVYTVVFSKPLKKIGNKYIPNWKKSILKFTELDKHSFENDKLIFPEDTMFTALGHVYATQNSYDKIARTVLDDHNKRLLMSNTNLMASEMSKISATTPEMAHEISMKRMEIEKVKQEKMMKMGQVV